MTRKNFTRAVLVARFKHCGGRCEYVDPVTKIRCDVVLVPGRWEGDHDNPDGLTGEPTFENCRCLCIPHHKLKTKGDRAAIDQAKRREAADLRVPSRPVAEIKSAPFARSDRTIERGKREPKPPCAGLPRLARQYGITETGK